MEIWEKKFVKYLSCGFPVKEPRAPMSPAARVNVLLENALYACSPLGGPLGLIMGNPRAHTV